MIGPDVQQTRKAEEARRKKADATSRLRETPLDFWVSQRPIWTFLTVAAVSTVLFVILYWMIGEHDIGGFELDEKITNYVGSLTTTVVALAGALVSVMLARLALKLGREAKDAAERGNEIQYQMQKFANPAFVETREGHKAAAELDLLGTLLCVYAAEVFSSTASDRPIEPIRHTYKRGNDLISDPALYRYCAQLIGTVEATTRFAATQARIYEATRMLGRDGELGRNDAITTARNAERIAIEIASLSRTLERAKQSVLANDKHHLHALAKDLNWDKPENSVSGCESTARMYLLETTTGAKPLIVAGLGVPQDPEQSRASMAPEALLGEGGRSVVHVLETDLPDLLHAFGSPLDAAKVPDGADVVRHDSLRDFVVAGYEGRVGKRADVIVAGWDSTLKDEPGSVTYEKLYQPWDHVASTWIGLESAHLWGKATFLAKNPAFERAVAAALQDLEFLREMNLTDVSDDLYHRQGIDPADAGDEVMEREQRAATRSANRLRYIHAAIEDLRKIHDRKGSVIVPDRDSYGNLKHEDTGTAIVVIQPHFARIDMSLPGSGWEQQNQWFEDCIGRYSTYRWDGRSV